MLAWSKVPGSEKGESGEMHSFRIDHVKDMFLGSARRQLRVDQAQPSTLRTTKPKMRLRTSIRLRLEARCDGRAKLGTGQSRWPMEGQPPAGGCDSTTTQARRGGLGDTGMRERCKPRRMLLSQSECSASCGGHRSRNLHGFVGC